MFNRISKALMIGMVLALMSPAIPAYAAKMQKSSGSHCKSKKMSKINPLLCSCGAEDTPRVNGKCPKKAHGTKAMPLAKKQEQAAKFKKAAAAKKAQSGAHRKQSAKVGNKKANRASKKADIRTFYNSSVVFASGGSGGEAADVADAIWDEIVAEENHLADIDDHIAVLEEQAADVLYADGDADLIIDEIEDLDYEAAEVEEHLAALYDELHDAELDADEEALDGMEDESVVWED
jgi:hypothetical protein